MRTADLNCFKELKMKIIFFFTELEWGYQDTIYEFCKEHGYIPKWQKGFGWSIGVFENEVENDNNILAFIEATDTKIIKQSKSRVDVQAKNHLKGSRISELRLLYVEIQKENKRKNKKMVQIQIDDIFPKAEEIEETERIYHYKFTAEDIKKIEDDVEKYINSYQILSEYFKENEN